MDVIGQNGIIGYEKIGLDLIVRDKNFNPKHILECGQVFRYNFSEGVYSVISKDKRCKIYPIEDGWRLECSDPDYFANYFDLSQDYSAIIAKLDHLPLMREACLYGNGIRILRQDPYETLVSFIISANNNIPRIKKIIEGICRGYGKNCGDYYAFPTPFELATADVTFFRGIGAGYRAEYLEKTVREVAKCNNLDEIFKLDTKEASIKLKKYLGVGDKVADCILLFAYGKTDLFPVDTWIKKVYADIFGEFLPVFLKEYEKSGNCEHNDGEKSTADKVKVGNASIQKASTKEKGLNKNKDVNSRKMREQLVATYGNLSGFAQQYLFYYKRFLDGIN